ncbi:hypothetical protein VDGL01_02927 [Verticillium dahliae]
MAARRNHEFYELSEIRPGSHSSQATANLRATTSDPHTEPFSLKQFWSQHVSCVVDFDKCRDHLGMLQTSPTVSRSRHPFRLFPVPGKRIDCPQIVPEDSSATLSVYQYGRRCIPHAHGELGEGACTGATQVSPSGPATCCCFGALACFARGLASFRLQVRVFLEP